MHLKKLEMLGFKSFADRTELLFQPGMTAVVGPNGCGKSNVVDAFKWIFGEQSAKGMRGSEMKDVIFNGTQTRRPTGFAEVTIVFENSDRFLDIDYSEVAITRRLFRSGESEYLINKQKARLKDIRELFMGTGIGQTSYSILEQGKIDVLLQSSNVDRRVIFEEAAGISKYLAKKAEALRALLRVQDNLTRLNDIIDEVEKRLNRVKAQASKARRYRNLSERLKELRVRSTLEDFRQSSESRGEISFRLYFCELRMRNLDALIERVTERCEVQAQERRRQSDAIKAVREKLAQDDVLLERTRERIAHGRNRSEELLGERQRKAEELEATILSLQQLQERLEGERHELAELVEDLEARREKAEGFAREVEEIRASRESVEAQLASKKESVVLLMQECARLGNQLASVASELSNLKAQKERLSNVVTGFRAELESAREKEGEQRASLEKLRAEKEAHEKRLEAVGKSERETQERAEALGAEMAGNLRQLHHCRSRYEVLESLEENLEGIHRGVADILRRKDTTTELAQVHGMVASHVKVEKRVARAVEAALGNRAQSLVVETQEGALGLLDFAREEKVGGVQVISLDRIDRVPREHFPRQAGVMGPLRDRVEVPEEFEELFDRLLANVVLVEDFNTAIALSRNGLRPFRLVTLDGELLEPWGGLSIAGESELGLISRRSEMEELGELTKQLESRESELRGELTGLKETLAARRAERDRLREELSRLDRAAVQVQGTLDQLSSDVDRLQREIRVNSSELAEIDEQMALRERDRIALEEQSGAAGQERESVEQQVREQERELAGVKERELAAGEILTQARLDLAQAEKREEGLRELVVRQESNIGERQARMEGLREEISSLSKRQEDLQLAIARDEESLEKIRARQEDERKNLEGEESVDRELEGREEELRHVLEELHKEHARVQEERQSARLRDQEERHRRNSLVERLDEEYGLELSRLLEVEGDVLERHERWVRETGGEGEWADPDYPEECRYLLPVADWDREKAREETRVIQERIRRLGSVNLEALDELGELEERHRFQLAQRTDLAESETNLRAIIGEINRTSRELFLKTFEEVQTHFSDLFRKCFGGGKAELILEEGADVLEAGIDIVARPPGKKITRLSLMSGGEKTMTTIALLFALFRTRPSPFCILDEVDAPLDETNVRRFVVLLKDFISNTQFVVITHNKLTMTEASTLYGITMQERGVSKRVSVELSNYDAEKMEAAAAR